MAKQSVQFITTPQSRQLTEFAEKARASLERLAGAEVDFDAIGLQMLDEWIERHLKQFPQPSPEITMIWGAFLGETLRRKFDGQWAVNKSSDKVYLGILCSRSHSGLYYIDVMRQVELRLKKGMSESLAYYYAIKGVDLKTY
ncbi:MAG: hypothetical protein P1S60_04540 [Anaerolineae bacterium]|nr:hypothetical protein [Anaerolineae bacterium]